MKQTISINLAGLVFHIEKDAFDQLQHYLDQVKQHLENNESREEILQDIESRIAEIFQERTGSRKEAVTVEDIQAVKSSLGEPEAFSSGNGNSEEDEQKQEKTYTRKGQIHRDVENKVIGGVCSGIGQYYGFDPLWLRLAFVLAVLLSGTGILIYLILWIIIPAAKTPVQKMEMRGERVTVSNIEKSFSGKSHSHKTHQENFTEQRNDFAKQGKGILKTCLDGLEAGFTKLGNACRKATTKLEEQ